MTRGRIAFLFNHDAAHQVSHIAGIAREMAADGRFEIIAFASSPALRTVAETIIGPAATARIDWQLFVAGPVARLAGRAFDSMFPFSRITALDHNRDLFRTVDLVVSTERTCLRIKRALGREAPRFVYVPHGAGDRNVTYHPSLALYDLFLVAGRKYVDMAQATGLLHAGNAHRIIGYPKFDFVADRPPPPRLFDNDNPVFVYNAHFDPYLSSWYGMSDGLMDLFLARPERNLIVAPHVMLFTKDLHFSLEHRTARLRREIPQRFRDAPNILIDTGSERLFDMSYMRAADAYIGDVSSQVYEFLATPRPCFFLNGHGAVAAEDERYRMWRAGPVLPSVAALADALDGWQATGAAYAPAQRALIDYTFDITDVPSARRGADAIAEFASMRLEKRGPSA